MNKPPYNPIDVSWFSEADRAEFNALIDRRKPNQCWPWRGGTVSGYGVWNKIGLSWKAHRLAYAFEHGSIGSMLTVDHACEIKACCNPAHLETVTQSVNVRRYTERHPVKVHRCGHPRNPAAPRYCRPCRVQAVARSQSKRADYYREVKARNARERRAKTND